jgi:hypothetical protein
MVRQLSADDPFTLYDDPLTLQRELERSGVAATERVWLRYRRYLQQRERPLFAAHPLSSRHYPQGLRSENEALEMIQELASLANLGAPPEAPLVSVIVPCYGKLPVTLRCLESLLAERTYHSRSLCRVELVVLDDASPDGSGGRLEQLDGLGPIRVLRNTENLGFLRTCNRGAGSGCDPPVPGHLGDSGRVPEQALWDDPHRAVAYAFTRMPGWHGRHSGHMRGHDEGHRVPEFRTPDT